MQGYLGVVLAIIAVLFIFAAIFVSPWFVIGTVVFGVLSASVGRGDEGAN